VSASSLLAVEPDLVGVWKKNVWLFGLRTPFSLVLVSWITMASALAPEFHLDRYLLILAAGFFGLIIGAHYIDLTASEGKYLPYFPRMNRKAIGRVGVLTVLVGAAIGVYISIVYSIWFLPFVITEAFFALSYPLAKPRWVHNYPGFAIAWGFIPALASYYLQALRLDLTALAIAVFLAITVTQMHHLAILTNETEYSKETTKNARFLLKLHSMGAYAIGLILLLARLI